MPRRGGSRHSDDEDRGVRAFCVGQELRRDRRGDFARHRLKDAGDQVYGAVNLDRELSGSRFHDLDPSSSASSWWSERTFDAAVRQS
ncbi:hypothetical protein TIFTF001_004753 [Ficus carica]|uniref:Uncharacterized protein n=1 Tax=Ficus carica TaxID=3494 RepID=A0AA88CXR1_FICCA|nr:hypothetical protein TIFTF001_004753 [Ficus carica]